jgi:hypothetical protein
MDIEALVFVTFHFEVSVLIIIITYTAAVPGSMTH